MAEVFDDSFRHLVGKYLPEVESKHLVGTGTREERREERRKLQRDQVRRLLTAERTLQLLLLQEPALCHHLYQRLLVASGEKRGATAMRPYLRERQSVFIHGRACPRHKWGRSCSGCDGGYVPRTAVREVAGSDAMGYHVFAAFRLNALFAMFVVTSGVFSPFVDEEFRGESWWVDRRWWRCQTDGGGEHLLCSDEEQPPGWKRVGRPRRPLVIEPEVVRLVKEILAIRRDILDTNLSLAVERSKVFWGRVQRSHLSRMDLLHCGVEGLVVAVDKIVLQVRLSNGAEVPWDPADPAHGGLSFISEPGEALCATAVRRMTGNFIENYSATMVHFLPDDRRRLYRARSAAQYMLGKVEKCECEGDESCEKCGGEGEYRVGSPHLDFERLAEAVCKIKCRACVGTGARGSCSACHGVGTIPAPDPHATPQRIAEIMAAASCRSAVGEDGSDETVLVAAPEVTRPDVASAQAACGGALGRAISTLPWLERKTLLLSGVDEEEFAA